MVKSVKTTRAPSKKATGEKKIAVKRNVKQSAGQDNKSLSISSKKYTNMFAAYRAFWRRGFTDWRGTTSLSGYWWAALVNALVVIALFGLYIWVGRAITFGTITGGIVLLFMMIVAALIVYGLAIIVPSLSIIVRRLHDGGFSAWWVLLYPATALPYVGVFAGIILLVFMLMPTKVEDNPYHQFNE